MSTYTHLDRICAAALAAVLLLTLLFVNAEALGVQPLSSAMGYETRLFDPSAVHQLDIVMEDWEEFCANAKSEEYASCSIVIDNESYKNVGIRTKGNSSLSQTEAYGNDRYSFKIEFDHYDSTKSYYGLDKLCLNNIIQDNTYMKDYLVYQMMSKAGAAAPLCSYVYLRVNGEDWGLYLAVEGIEEAFLQRNYGRDYGELYKPDSMDLGGGQDNGGKRDREEQADSAEPKSDRHQEAGMRMGSSQDVLLQYIDDNAESYPNIFDNAKTDCSDSDQARLIEALKRLSAGEDLSHTLDIEAVIRYFVVHNFVLNFDSYTGSIVHNYYLYEEDGRLQMIPWDYNLAFGGFQSSSGAAELVNFPIDSPVSSGSIEERPMLAWIFADEAYTEQYHQYFAEFIADWFDSGLFEETIGQVSALIQPYVEKDPTKFCTYEEFLAGVSALREFCLLRAQSIQGQLDGSIGSTSDTQDRADWIDAGDLQLSAMNSMGRGGNQGAGRFPGNGNGGTEGGEFPDGRDRPAFPGTPDTPSEESEKDKARPAMGNIQPGENRTPPEFPGGQEGNGTPPELPGGQENAVMPEPPQSSAQTPGTAWIGLAASMAVLAVGIAVAAGFKRRR